MTVNTTSFGGELTMMVGLDAEGAVTGVKVTVHADTPGVGTKNMEPSYLSQYSGISELTSASDVKKESAELASGGRPVCSDGRCTVMENKNKVSILTNGLIKENPVLVLVLGTCPTLATTTSLVNGFGMGISATAVLICSNIVISLLRKIIPDNVRIPCYITVIAGFVTIVQLIVKAFAPALDESLGLYLPLIVVNCIILGRAEMFANKNSVVDSALDGIGMGLGFTLTLCVMGSIRELIGAGTIAGFPVLSRIMPGMSVLTLVPGGFAVYSFIMAFVHYMTEDKSKIRNSFGCSDCAMQDNCVDGSGCANKEVA